jgi:sigma-E factor negative regulatory protein RseB
VVAPWVQAQTVGDDVPAQAREVRSWLMRIHDAAGHRNFEGTFVVSGGGTVSSARIAHYCEGTSQFERSEALVGQAREVLRRDDEVTTLWPASRTAVIEQRSLAAQFPALLAAGADRIADHYEVSRMGVQRVAGREANVLTVRPRDPYRYGYRLWADQTSGLLLRADVLGLNSEVLETSAFSDVVIGVKAQPDSVLLPMHHLQGYHVLRPTLTPTQLQAEGWQLRAPVAGFEQVSCVLRSLPAVGPSVGPVGGDRATSRVLQTIFSDGLAYVSVFIEPFNPSRHTRAVESAVGPTQTLTLQQGDWWVTVLGDVPPATLRAFAAGLARTQK